MGSRLKYRNYLTRDDAEVVREKVKGSVTYAAIERLPYAHPEDDAWQVRLWNGQTERAAYVNTLDEIDDAIEKIGHFDASKPSFRRPRDLYDWQWA